MSRSNLEIALLVPARNESTVIAPTLKVMKEALRREVVSHALVLDSGSTDGTADIVNAANVECCISSNIHSDVGEVLGKGDSLWRGLCEVKADIYLFMDADLGNVTADHLASLVEPLRRDSRVMFVKSGFVRVDEHGVPRDKTAGRVTDEVGRPLAARENARLGELSQPLSGQVAVRAKALQGMSIATGYGIEIAMLIDMWRAFGDAGIAEVDWGPLHNRWKPDEALTEVRNQVLAGATLRGVTLPQYGEIVDSQVVDRQLQ